MHLLQTGSSQHQVNNAVYAIKWAHECAGLQIQQKILILHLYRRKRGVKLVGLSIKKGRFPRMFIIELCDKYIDESDLLIVRNLTMILFCFAGFLRFDEVSSSKFKNVHVYDEYIVSNIQKSKTDRYRQGNEVLIANGVTTACPVKMYLRYLDLLGTTEDKYFFLI